MGHRTGLFDAMATLLLSTSEEIAYAADLNERYVREWPGAMVVGRVVEHDPEKETYHLPLEYALSAEGGAESAAPLPHKTVNDPST